LALWLLWLLLLLLLELVLSLLAVKLPEIILLDSVADKSGPLLNNDGGIFSSD
jgi:hypothetical protein